MTAVAMHARSAMFANLMLIPHGVKASVEVTVMLGHVSVIQSVWSLVIAVRMPVRNAATVKKVHRTVARRF